MSQLDGKVIVITGSTRGIGRAIALACARAGAHVVVNGRTEGAVRAVLSDVRATGATASGVAGNVAEPDDVQRVFDHAIAEHGRVDVWFNNAGLSGGMRPLDELDTDEILEMVDVNLGGVMLGCRVVVPYMREHGGIIVNLCGRGSRGEVAPFGAAYAATKAAIASLTRSIAEENKDATRLTICGLLPGMVPTDFYENLRISERCAELEGNMRVALDAFGAGLDEVGALAVRIAAQTPGTDTGKIHSIISRSRAMRGVAKLVAARMTGRMK